MAAQTTVTRVRGGTRGMNLLRYIVQRFSAEPESETCLVHGDIFAVVGIRDRRTWLKYLHGLEADKLLDVCYGKNQYAPTKVRPGEMLWHFKDEMLWHGYEHVGQVKHMQDDDAIACLRVGAGASTRSYHGSLPAKTLTRSQKKNRVGRTYAMALPKNAMAYGDAMAFTEARQVSRLGSGKVARTSKLQNNAMAHGNAMAFSADLQVPWHENAMTLFGRPDFEFESCFCNVVFFNDLKNFDNYRYIINTEYSISTKIINLRVGSVLSGIVSGTTSGKVTHTHFCSAKTERGRRKEKTGGGQLTAAAVRPLPDIIPIIDVDGTAMEQLEGNDNGDNVWRQWVRMTAHRLMIDTDAFSSFSERWIARARLNGKLAKYQTHSIKDFIIQDFMKEQTDKCNEAVMTAAIQSGSTPTTKQVPAPIAQTQGLRIPRGVTLCNRWWGSTQDKQMELRGIAADYEYQINKILLGRGREVGLHKLMELHDIFRLNIPAYAARYPGIGHDDTRGYQAAEQWIYAAARVGYSPKNILQQAGFC